jgi:2-polyprenyl-3-methyl-5-hydroxy-6-metoxy-1,4-benzoquinol methylase
MNKTQNCFQCRSSENLEKLFVTTDIYRKISKETFNYYNCSKCDHVFLRNVPNNLGEYYGDEYYDLPSIESLKKTALNEKFKFDIVRDYFNEGDKICEIGPSVGVFLYNAKLHGLKCTGIEMSTECCEFMSETLKINAINTNTPEIEIKKIEKQKAFFLWHSLEHIENPSDVLDACIEKLEPNGLIIIACPNPDSISFKITGKNWPHLDAPRHINLFSISTLKAYMKKKNLKDIMKTTNDLSSKYYNSFSWQLFLFNFFNKDKTFNFQKKNVEYFFWKIIGKIVTILMYPLENKKLKGSCYTIVFQKKEI